MEIVTFLLQQKAWLKLLTTFECPDVVLKKNRLWTLQPHGLMTADAEKKLESY